MIKFFRKIRQNLLAEGKTEKYLKYAVGEILLVMVGILLALQVNTWSEEKKNKNIEFNYLKGIKDDFNSDVQNMVSIIIRFDELRKKFLLLDSLNEHGLMSRSYLKELGPPMKLVVPPITFRYNSGYYISMISEGKSELISNSELLNKIQNVYNIDYKRLSDISHRIDQQADLIRWELRDYRYNRLDSLYLNKANVIDILSSMGLRNHYENVLKENRENVLEVIKLIDTELEILTKAQQWL